MIKLKMKQYNYKEIKNLEKSLNNKIKPGIIFLLENIQGLRLLGYELHIGQELSCKHAYHDVIKVNKTLEPLQAILIKKKKEV